MKYPVLLCLVLGCRRERAEVKSDPAATPPKRVRCSIPEEDPIVTTVEVPARCDLTLQKTRHIGRGGVLTIAQGAKLSFVKGAGLAVEGGALIARGTKEEPVTFGSVSQQPLPGDWIGLRFLFALAAPSSGDAGMEASAPASSSLEHFVVEFAGEKLADDPPAAIAVSAREPKSIHFAHGRIRKNAATGLRLAITAAFSGAEDLVFSDNGGISLDATPSELATIVGSTFDEAIRLGGTVSEPIVLPAASAYIFRRVTIHSPKSPASLTFPEGSVVKFEKNGALDVGFSFGGATPGTCTLVAKKVTFTSASTPPTAGDWVGVALHDGCSATIEDAVVEYAGHKPGSVVRGGIEIPTDDKSISVLRTTFKNLGGPAFRAESSCKSWSDPTKANVYTGGKLCEVVPSPLAGSFGMIGLLGSSGSSGSLSSVFGSDAGDGLGFGSGGLGMVGTGPGGYGGLGDSYGGTIGKVASGKVREVSVTTAGKLPNEVVRRILRSRMGSLRACYGSSTLSGTLSARLEIDAKGAVTSAKSTGGTLTDSAIVSCVTSSLGSLSFPEPESGTVTADATWDFSPP